MKFIIVFFLIGGILIIAYRLFSFKRRNKISAPEQENILKIYKDKIILSNKNLKCHNWNPGIKNYHYLFNNADLHLTEKKLLIIPSQKSVLGMEKWTPIIITSKKKSNKEIENQNGIITREIDKIEISANSELKIFFRENSVINSTVELNFKNVDSEFLVKTELWAKSTAGNTVYNK